MTVPREPEKAGREQRPEPWEPAMAGPAALLLRWATLGLSLLFPLLFLWVALHRLRYPFEIDRMESGMLTSVWRLRHGFALYSAPSMEWAPFLYAPLFFYLSAAVTRLVGIQYAALRLVSILATVGSLGLIVALVRIETRRSWVPALFAAGLFASLYPFVQAWYDVGRVDSLSLLFFLLALFATRRWHPVSAAVIWCLAFLTKQTFLPLGLAFFLVHWSRPRRMLTGMLTFLALVASSYLWLQHTSHGWFRYYAFGTTGVIKWSWHTAVMFPFADVLAPLPIACGLILLAALFGRRDWHTPDKHYFVLVTVLLFGAVGYVRGHVGANLNAIIPLYAWLSVLAGIALDRLLAGGRAVPQPTPASVPAVLLWLLATIQLAAHLYRPAEIHVNNLAARTAFLDALRKTPGDVWVADHSFDAILAGKPVHADMDALDAVLGRRYQPALDDFQRVVSSGSLTAVVLDRAPQEYEPKGIFTTNPFTARYRVWAMAPGSQVGGEIDQPVVTLLPCSTASTPQGLTDLHGTLADRSGC